MKKKSGFTLIELMVSMSIIAIIVGVYLVAANPAGQLASARNTKRTSDLQTILLAIRQNIADQSNEQFSCAASHPHIDHAYDERHGGIQHSPVLVPTYAFNLPFDPTATSGHYTSNTNYDTGYSIVINSSTGQITLSAPYAELKKTISITQ